MGVRIERSDDGRETALCMSQLQGIHGHTLSDTQAYAALGWLAILHGAFWGAARADAVVRTSGLQAQGCFWDLDARPEELERIPETGWASRMRHAARGVDMRLKADRCQTIVHGDATAENLLLETF